MVHDALGTDRVVPALPLKKKAMSVGEAADFFRAALPTRVHLLGLGPTGPLFPAVRRALLRACPTATTSCDSVVITANVGQGRPLTEALREVVGEITDKTWHTPGPLDYTDSIGFPSEWMTEAEIVSTARRFSLPVPALTEADITNPFVSAALDWAWSRHVTGSGTGLYRKRESIRRLCASWRRP